MFCKVLAIALFANLPSYEAACPCKATPANPKQASAPGKPAYVGQVPAYGWGCKAHDMGNDTCATATDTAPGQPNDWCLDKFCIVDPNNCDFNARPLTYTNASDDYFSYEACDANFTGNGWVGRCKNCPGKPTSFCDCGGLAGCKCKAGSAKQTPAQGKPAYVGQVESYGYGCMAHDKGKGSCATATDTAPGQPNDWCNDAWCVVDPASCNLKATGLTYTAPTNDYFAYETCNASFAGNGWVGRCKCVDNAKSYCACDSGNVNFASSVGLSKLCAIAVSVATLVRA